MLQPYQRNNAPELPPEVNKLSAVIVDSAYQVHHSLGDGLLESVYEICLFQHLIRKGHQVERQIEFPILFDGIRIKSGFRLDLLVESKVIVEIKAVERILPVHGSQLLTYLKLTGRQLGLLINFNVPLLKEGIKRVALSNAKK